MPHQLFFTHGYALLIGVGGRNLEVTASDAAGLKDILVDQERCAYQPQQVRLLTESQATQQEIIAGLEWLGDCAKQDPDATVLIYFSGHGVRTPISYLVPHGFNIDDLAATAVSGAHFTQLLEHIPSRKLLVLLDCCHAGAMAQFKTGLPLEAPPELYAKLTAGSGRVLIASSKHDQESLTSLPYSFFTQALREALTGYAMNKPDGYAYVADIARYVSNRVYWRTNGRQEPVFDLQGADNFAIAYYAGSAVQPKGGLAGVSHRLPAARLPATQLISGPAISDIRAEIRKFSDDELTTFCIDFFPEVALSWGAGQSLTQKVNVLMDRCLRRSDERQRLADLLFSPGRN